MPSRLRVRDALYPVGAARRGGERAVITQKLRLRGVLVREAGWENEAADSFVTALDEAFAHLATKDDLRVARAEMIAAVTTEMWKILAIGLGIGFAMLTIASGIIIAVLS